MRKSVLVAALALAPALAPVSAQAADRAPASQNLAAGSVAICTPDAACSGSVEFWPVGDRVQLCDWLSDGYGVKVRVTNVTKDPDVREYTLPNTKGAGKCVTRDAGDQQPWNLAEKHCFRFAVWLVNNGQQVGDKRTVQLRNYNNDGPVTCPGVD